ncbi:MAG: HAMP domain-containing sensor histidine kinase [Leifsonia flava]
MNRPAVVSARILGYRPEAGIQLAVLVVVAVAILVSAIVDPAPLRTVAFAVAVSMVGVATALTIVAGRTDSVWLLLAPVLDMGALVVMKQMPDDHVHAVGYLAILPALWLGWSGRPVFAWLAVLLSLGLVELPSGGTLDLEHALNNFLIPTVVAVSAACTFVAARRTATSIRLLTELEQTTARALEREKNTSQLLDGILDTVNIGILAYDTNGKQILANRTVLKHPVILSTSLSPLELDQQGFMLQVDRVTPAPTGFGIITRALRGEEYSNQIVWVSAPGTRQHALAASARPLLDADGGLAGTVVAVDDVTAYLEAIAAKDEFVGSVSHELRTPLASLIGYLELVLEARDRLPEDVRPHLAVMERNADRLQRIVTQLIDEASRKRGTVRPQRERTDVVALCEAVLERCRAAAANAGMGLELNAPVPVSAVINGRQVGQAIDNLVSNVMKLSPSAGRIIVTVTDDGDLVTIVVRDFEAGMPNASLGALAGPTGGQDRVPGIELGLTVAKSIIEQHRGSLSFDNGLGRGTTVTATFAVR